MALEDIFDPFEALGLERDASTTTIRAKYYDLALRYHPNRNQGPDEAKGALAEHFHYVHQAWQLLSDADKRRRCIELLQLSDLQDTVYTSVADLIKADEHPEQHIEHSSSVPDGHISSDADDDDLPRIAGIKRRATFERPTKRSTGGLDDIEEGSDSSEENSKGNGRGRARVSELQGKHESGKNEEESSDNSNTAAERRRRFDKLRRREYEAFNEYRDAMVAKFEAEFEAQRCKEQFEQARWRRQYYERAPKDGSQRVRLLRIFNSAAKALAAHQPIRRRISTKSSIRFATAITPMAAEAQPAGLLTLPSKMKSVHKRGFSDDITGDQTSSEEENSSDKNTSPHRSPRASSPRPGRGRHRRYDSVPSVPSIATRSLPNGNHDPISPITGPLKVFVRTPTNLAQMAAAVVNGSDADSASASSRSASPQLGALKKNDSGRFVMIPTTGGPNMFAIAEDRARSRSPSADRRSISGTTVTSQNSTAAACQFMVKQVGHLQHQHIRAEHVHLLTYEEKQWMLGVDPDAEMDPETLLHQLAKLDQKVATGFMVKPDIKAKFNFRLVYSNREIVKQQHQGFIALSYRRKLQVERRHSHFTLPLEAEMFQAVWDERASDNEGVWIDQICIDGESEEEKIISMSAMDMVYRSARLVVVALDDVDLEASEGTILESHMLEFDRQTHVKANKRFRRRQTPYLEQNVDLCNVIRKILMSSWFQRAWCRHEMRLAREHIFLVPCRTSSGPWFSRNVLRFTGKCLTHFLALATEVTFDDSIEIAKAALYAFFRDRSKLPAHEFHLRSHHGNFTTVVAEVFAMQAGGDPKIPEQQREADARKDKISIILNTMECGLALSPKMRNPKISLPMHECQYMMLLLALAARDPGALSSVGRPLRQLPYGLASSWLSAPTNVDSGLNNYRTLNRLPETSKIATGQHNGEHFVNLTLKFLDPSKALNADQSPKILELAQKFMKIGLERKVGRIRRRYLLNNAKLNETFGSMQDVYVQTLACIFDCGPGWMSEVCERYGVGRWKHDLQGAWELVVALKSTDGKWPEEAWSNQAVGFIMDFVNFLVVRGLPHRGATGDMEDMCRWRPVSVPTVSGGKVLTFAPREEVTVAVPVALFDTDYVHLARLWVLKPRGPKDEWTLLGKSVLFSDDASMETLDLHTGMVQRAQRVFGRSARVSLANVASAAMRMRTLA